MPLTTCPDCRKEISTEAPACPGCGRPMAARLAWTPARPAPRQAANSLKVIGALVTIAAIPGCFVVGSGGGAVLGGMMFFVGIALFIAGRLRD